jgi:probable F420-dependent oxidoreductase
MELGRLGVWCSIERRSAREAAAFARRLEAWGYTALWQPEGLGRDVLVASSYLLANTEKLIVASGIANIYARDAQSAAAAQKGLNEQSGGRFLLGLGVSHTPLVEGLRGHHYGKPIAAMREYLAAMGKATYMAPPPPERPLTVLAALGPRMVELSGEQADGAHSYNVTPEHTADARKRLGAGKLLCVEQKVMLTQDAAQARALGRTTLKFYLALVNYQESWRRLGFDEQDWSGDGSDRLIDAMFAWGDERTVMARVQQHWDAGADHVCIHPIGLEDTAAAQEAVLERLAPG